MVRKEGRKDIEEAVQWDGEEQERRREVEWMGTETEATRDRERQQGRAGCGGTSCAGKKAGERRKTKARLGGGWLLLVFLVLCTLPRGSMRNFYLMSTTGERERLGAGVPEKLFLLNVVFLA